MIVDRRDFIRSLAAAGAAVVLAPHLAQAADEGIDALKRTGLINIGCEATYPPFSFRKDGTIVGYDVDLATAIFSPSGIKPNFIDTEWAGVIPSLYAGRFDIVMSSMSYTAERMAKVAFSIPYADASQALLIRTADAATIKSLDDLAGRVIGVKLGSPGQQIEQAADERLKTAGGKGFASVKTYDDHPAAYMALAQGTVDGVLNTLPTLTEVLKSHPNQFSVVLGVGKRNFAGIAARKDGTALVNFIDSRLLALANDGSLAALQEKWFGLRFDLPQTLPTF